MEVVVKDFLLYLIDKQECTNCKFESTCDGLDDKGEHCLCDIAYQDLIKR